MRLPVRLLRGIWDSVWGHLWSLFRPQGTPRCYCITHNPFLSPHPASWGPSWGAQTSKTPTLVPFWPLGAPLRGIWGSVWGHLGSMFRPQGTPRCYCITRKPFLNPSPASWSLLGRTDLKNTHFSAKTVPNQIPALQGLYGISTKYWIDRRINHINPNPENSPLFARARFFFSFGATIVSFIGYFEPSKSKYITNLFTETYSKMLCAGLEIRSLQIVNHKFTRRFAEQR